jgi:hypothetical protein
MWRIWLLVIMAICTAFGLMRKLARMWDTKPATESLSIDQKIIPHLFRIRLSLLDDER